MRIKVLGAHNTESINTRYASLLVDDIMVLDAGGLTSSLSFDEQMKIKAVLLTHGHYDHIRDIPAFAMNLFLRKQSVDIYTHQSASEYLEKYFLNGDLYPQFHQRPTENPTLKIHILQPGEEVLIEGYKVLPAPVTHALPAIGYQVTSPDGKTIFYTGDTGPNLSGLWNIISPQVLFIELTAPNRWEESMSHTGHLTPNLLDQELDYFREIKGYMPQIVCLHINPAGEDEIRSEISTVAESLGITIQLAYEGMQIEI